MYKWGFTLLLLFTLLISSTVWADTAVCPNCVSLNLQEVDLEKFAKLGCQILHWNCLVPHIEEEEKVDQTPQPYSAPRTQTVPNPTVAPVPSHTPTTPGAATQAPTPPAQAKPAPAKKQQAAARKEGKREKTSQNMFPDTKFSIKTSTPIPAADFEKFFRSVYDEMGYRITEKDFLYVFEEQEEKTPSISAGYVCEMVNLKYIQPQDFISAISALYPSSKLQYIQGRTSVMVFDTKTAVGSIMDLAYKLDVPSKIETFVYSAKHNLPSKIVTALGANKDQTMNAVDEAGVIVVRATADNFMQIVPQLKSLDVLPQQILVDVTVYEISRTAAKNFSFDILYKGSNDLLFTSAGIIQGGLFTGGLGGILSYAVGGGARLSMILDTLTNKSVARVVARPSLLLQSGNKARVELDSQIPLATGYTATTPTSTTTQGNNTTASTTTVGQITYENVGIILDLQATVIGENISLTISQELSNPGSTFAVAGQSYGSVDQRKASTVATVKTGQMLFMAGLSRDAYTYQEQKNWLSELPVIGKMFTKWYKTDETQDLLIIVKPYIIRDDNRGIIEQRLTDRIKVIQAD